MQVKVMEVEQGEVKAFSMLTFKHKLSVKMDKYIVN